MQIGIDENSLKDAIIESLSTDYQALFIVEVETDELAVYKYNFTTAIPGTLEKANLSKSYEFCRKWYINNYAIEEHRERMLLETEYDNVLAHIANGDPYIVEYKRKYEDAVNYNQLYYKMINQKDGNVKHFIVGFRNVDINQRAELDELTKLYVRKSFLRRANELIAKNKDVEYTLMLSDIVDFKDINEYYGTQIGDEILKYAAAFLHLIMRDDLIVGRYGSDQFAVLMRHDEYVQAIDNGGDKALEISMPNTLPKVSIKYGVCEYVDHNASVIVACDRAKFAVDSIKHIYGKNVAKYDDNLKMSIQRQRIIENDMRNALSEGQFKVYYQPKISTVNDKIIGAEALIRWVHPEYGFMSPGEFIPLFEKNGFITETDKFVYERTCKNLKRWQDKNINIVPVSVNASKLTFARNDMTKSTEETMKKVGISPEYLHIEVTESLMSENTEELIKKLDELKRMGIQIELDDFGSGYSSINMLSSLPLDVIKLDMSFMKQFGDPKRAKVLELCVDMAKNLGYKTVSEGVETKEQSEAVKKLGVDVIQGFYYSKPLPEEEFEEYLKNQ